MIFEDPYANAWVAEARVDPDSDNPSNVVCNGGRCLLFNGHGEWIPMSREERNNWRLGNRLSLENERFNDEVEDIPAPPEDTDREKRANPLLPPQ